MCTNNHCIYEKRKIKRGKKYRWKSDFHVIIAIGKAAVDAAAQRLKSASETPGFHRVASRLSPIPQDIPREYPRELQMFRYRSFHSFENEAMPLFAELKYGNFICVSCVVPRARQEETVPYSSRRIIFSWLISSARVPFNWSWFPTERLLVSYRLINSNFLWFLTRFLKDY